MSSCRAARSPSRGLYFCGAGFGSLDAGSPLADVLCEVTFLPGEDFPEALLGGIHEGFARDPERLCLGLGSAFAVRSHLVGARYGSSSGII
jgi:hypothetical protein